MYVAFYGAYASHMLMLLQNMSDRHAFADNGSEVAGTPGKAMRGGHGVCDSCIRFIACQSHALTAIARRDVADFARTDQLCVDSLLLLHLHVSPNRLYSLLIDQDNHARGDKPTVSPNEIIEVLEDGETIPGHTYSEIIGVVLP